MNKILQLHPNDNLIVALQPLTDGESFEINGYRVSILSEIPEKHKFALKALDPGESVYLYGVLVGKSVTSIQPGELITTENIEHATGEIGDRSKTIAWEVPDITKWKELTFEGYHRPDGKVGTANYWLVFPLVFCELRNIEIIEAALSESLGYITKKDFGVNIGSLVERYQSGASEKELLETPVVSTREESTRNRVFPNIDGVKFLKHTGGCGGTRQDAEALCQLLAGYVTHPNVAGATALSLGCQNAEIRLLEEAITKRDQQFAKPLYILEQQQSKDERQFIEEAVKSTFMGLMKANEFTRQPAPLSKLVLGLECGGSDGFSGISANPTLGYTSDLLVSLGGAAVLSEFPELNGVEQELINRCESDDLAEKFASLMQTYNSKAMAVGSGFKANPSPGNIKDGLITDAIKSAGAAKKGGTSPVVDVLDYTEPVTKKGLNLLCTPGNDVESTTGLVGSGANIVVFTTGLGTPTGNPIAPVIKVSTNTKLAKKMQDIIDLDTGAIIEGQSTIEEKGEDLLDYILDVASGKATPHAVRLGQDDFIPWKRGISL